jgi:NADH-quinone oxidoreductase subunit L
VDAFAIDGVLVNGTARLFGFFGRAFRGVQNGDAQRYAAVMAIAAAVILWTVIGMGGR